MTYFVDDFKQALQTITQKYPKKDNLVHLMNIRYGLDGNGGATLESIGQREDVQLTRERVRQVVKQGRDLLPNSFLKKTYNEVSPLLKIKGWIDFKDVLALPYFTQLQNSEALSYWLDDVGYGRWQHQGTLYFYDPKFELQDIQNKIRNERKKRRRAKSDARRSTLVSSAIKMPQHEHHLYWNQREEKGKALMQLYTQAIEYALSNPERLLSPPSVEKRKNDIQVGLRMNKTLMSQVKKAAKQHKMGTTLFIRQALIAYIPNLK